MNSASGEYISIPKKGSVLKTDGKLFKKVIYSLDFSCSYERSELTIKGPLYSPLPNSIFPPRTLYRKIQIENSSDQYLEVKGYGRAGKEMYFQNHVSGDIFYGMYLINAVHEFERMRRAYDLGLPVPLPLAVVEIPRDEYIKHGLMGFQKTIEALVRLRGIDIAKIKSLLRNIRNQSNAGIPKKLIDTIQSGGGNIVDVIRFIVSRLSVHPWQGFGINDKADALFSERRVGYLLRISKSPYRVGDPSNARIKNDKFSKIAESMGNTFRVLLENSILHHCPGTGNWTQSGELTDFADTFDLQQGGQELHRHIENLQEKGVIKTTKFEDFLKYLIGPEHTGALCEDFLKGICGKKVSLEEAVEQLLKIMKSL